MSRKTTQFRRKIKQAIRKGTPTSALVPTAVVKSDGRATFYGHADATDEETGKPQKEGRRYPGRASNAVVTQPMDPVKATRLCNLK